jgi:hypothetical protein
MDSAGRLSNLQRQLCFVSNSQTMQERDGVEPRSPAASSLLAHTHHHG